MVIRGGTVVNLAGTTPIDDPDYRYKMPAVFGKVEGSGNGIKTAIPNITDLANSLHRQPGEVNKFFGCELGAQTRYNAETDRAIVNGKHTDDVLQDLVHRYIDKFVLCPNCNLPETEYRVKNDCIYHKCAACGAKEMVDMQHKLCNYILNEEKKAKKEGKGKNKKDDKKKSKKKDRDDSSEEKKKKDKKKDKKKEKKSKKEKDASENGDKDYIKEALAGGKKDDDELLGSDDDAASVASEAGVDDRGALLLAIEETRKYLEENSGASVADIVDIVKNQQMASALKSHDRVQIFIRAALTPKFFKNKEVEKYAPVIREITGGSLIMERHLIASLEVFCVDKPKNFPVLIKLLFDEDALEEEAVLEWADEGRNEFTLEEVDEETRAQLRGEAEPVVVWLQEADSDDSDDSDDE